MMTLKDYLHSFNITLEAFSREVDIPYTTLTKYVYGQRIPSLTYMKRINKYTKGAVSANDFYSTVSEEDWQWRITYERDFSKATEDAKQILGDMDIHPLAFSVVVEMVSQMGIEGVSQFKNFINALEKGDYQKAAQEMRDSRWGKQTPKIADTLANKMSSAT
jgi:lysozyme